VSSEHADEPPPPPPAAPPAAPPAPPAPPAAPPTPPPSPWAADGGVEPTPPPPAAATSDLALDPTAAGLPEPGRRSRRWADATAAIVLLVSAGAVLAAASPAIGRTFSPDPPTVARRGLGQAIRLRGLALGAPAEGATGEGRDVAPDLERRGESQYDDPLGGSDRAGPGLERLDPWRRAERGRATDRAEGAEPGARGQGGEDGAPRYRLGMAAVGTVLRERPERDGAVLAPIAQGEVLLVAAAVEGWLYVAFSTDQGTVAGWVQRSEVVLP
jgi:hypothetical protein